MLCYLMNCPQSLSPYLSYSFTASVASLSILPVTSSPFYTGTQLTFYCTFAVPLSLNAEINSNVMMEGLYETPEGSYEIKEGSYDGRLTISDLTAFTPSGKNWLYRSSITISPLVRTSDIGQWTCQVNFTSDNALIISSSFKGGYYDIHEMETPGKREEPSTVICQF